MNRKRSCAAERRIDRLKQLGRLADAALTKDAADDVIRIIGSELQRLGIYPITEQIDRPADVGWESEGGGTVPRTVKPLIP